MHEVEVVEEGLSLAVVEQGLESAGKSQLLRDGLTEIPVRADLL
jgi:hypothetical protein